METRTRRQAVLLAALVAVLAAALWWNLSDGSSQAPAGAPKAGAPRTARAAAQEGVEDLHIEALRQPRPDPANADRDPFRFKPKPPPSPPASQGNPAHANGSGPQGGGAGSAAVAAGPPPPPPIPLKFIGIIEEAERHRKLAALSDGRFTYYGREGDIIEGRYRIVRIGVESIEMVYVDGRGPQTIRLSGS